MYCGQCGAQIDGAERFCPRCGAAIGADVNGQGGSEVVQGSQAYQVPSETVESARVTDGMDANLSTQQVEEAQPKKRGRIIGIVGIVVIALIVVVANVVGRTAGSYFAETVTSAADSAETERIIRDGLQSDFDALTDHTSWYRDTVFALGNSDNEDAQALQRMGISADDFLDAIFEGFSAHVDGVNLTENTGYVDVTVRHKNLTGVFDSISQSFDDAWEAGDISSPLSDDETNAWYATAFLDAIHEAPLVEEQCDLKIKKTGNTWSLDEDDWEDACVRMFSFYESGD